MKRRTHKIDAGVRDALDEMSYPDWELRLERAKRESKQGEALSLDAYIMLRRRSSP